MKLMTAMLLVVSMSSGLAGCSQNVGTSSSPSQSPDEQVRAAIQQRLAHDTSLNLQAFDTEIKQVTIQGDHAHAQVDFRVKGGPGAMELTYALEKRDGNWTVTDTDSDGGNVAHPGLDPGKASATGGAAVVGHSLSDTLKSFKNGAATPSQNLPPGHPPINGAPAPPAP